MQVLRREMRALMGKQEDLLDQIRRGRPDETTKEDCSAVAIFCSFVVPFHLSPHLVSRQKEEETHVEEDEEDDDDEDEEDSTSSGKRTKTPLIVDQITHAGML